MFYQGDECGTIRRYPEGLMQFLLRGAMPLKYREQHDVKLDAGEGLKKFAGTMEELLATYRILTAPHDTNAE